MPPSTRDVSGGTTVQTACPLDCPDACSLAVTVNRGRIIQIDGSQQHAVTNGYICNKVRHFGERVYGAARLRVPGVRKGPKGSGSFARATWDEALDRVASRMIEVRDTWGAEAILPFFYGGSNGLVSQETTDARLFRLFGASRLKRTVCAAPTSAAARAMYGKMAGVSYPDYAHARLIVIWGANPSASGIHLVPFVYEAQRRGARLVVIDPRTTPLARRADVHLAVRPGTDLVVALALHRHLFEEGFADERFLTAHARGASTLRERSFDWTFERAAAIAGVEEASLRRLADLYVETTPAVIRCGWGLERNRNGGNAAMAIMALPAVGGKFGVRGGGYTMSNSAVWDHDASTWIAAEEPGTRVINMNHLGRVLTEPQDPPIKMLFVYNCNPAATMPDQNRVLRGLSRDDLFTVVFDQVQNDTTAYADVVLPATTFLESYDVVRGYGAISLQMAQPVIAPVGDARPNVEVFHDLAKRLGLVAPEEWETDATAFLHVLAHLGDARQHLAEQRTATPAYGDSPVQFVDVFPRTSDGLIDLLPEHLEREAPAGLYRYQPDPATRQRPLALISPASDKTISSTLGELRSTPAILTMHPLDANTRSLEDGDTVRIGNELGEVLCLVSLSEDVRPGTVVLPKGLWRKSTANGSTANALAPDTLTDLGGGACFNDARVQVSKVVDASWREESVSVWVTEKQTD